MVGIGGGRRYGRGDDAVFVYRRDSGVVLCQEGEDQRREASREVVERIEG